MVEWVVRTVPLETTCAFTRFCRGQNADSICGLTAVKPRLPQPKAAVSPRLVSAAVIRGRGKDYNILFALFQMAAFVLERDTMRLANAWHFKRKFCVRKLLAEKDALSENNRNLYTIGSLRSFRSVGRRLFSFFHVCCPIEISAKRKKKTEMLSKESAYLSWSIALIKSVFNSLLTKMK